MKQINTTELFNYVVEHLKDGEAISIGCETDEQLERVRAAFYRQKQALYKTIREVANSITISRRKSINCLVVGKSSEKFKVHLIDKEGNRTKELFNDDVRPGDADEVRQRELMAADGMSQEEIDFYFQEGKGQCPTEKS